MTYTNIFIFRILKTKATTTQSIEILKKVLTRETYRQQERR